MEYSKSESCLTTDKVGQFSRRQARTKMDDGDVKRKGERNLFPRANQLHMHSRPTGTQLSPQHQTRPDKQPEADGIAHSNEEKKKWRVMVKCFKAEKDG